jgi:predicted MFS family arabinose efflux permease
MAFRFRRRSLTTHLPSLLQSRSDLNTNQGLWSNADFRHLWMAESISQIGSQIAPVAIPLLAALTLGATPFQMGLLAAASGIPVLLIGVLAGAWVDRLRRKPLMLATDIGRALTLLAIPVAAWLDVLSIPLLVAISLLVGAQTVLFNAAYVSILPALVKRHELADANGKLYASMSVAQVVGPALAGTLVGLVTAPIVMIINAITYLGSGAFIRRIEHDERDAQHDAPREHLLREVMEGFRALFGSPVLRAISLSSATINLAGWVFLAVYVLYMTEDLHLSATGVGLVFAAGGVGSLIGSMLSARLGQRFGVGRTLMWSAILFGVFGLAVPVAILVPTIALPMVILAECLQWLTLIVFNVLALSLRQTRTPNHLLGRVSASNQVLAQGMMPIGSLLGGVIGSAWSVQAALLLGVGGMFLAAGWVIWSPVPGIAHLEVSPIGEGV